MPTATRPPSRDKVRAHRARMKKRGMRLIQMWVPDTRSKAFRRQAHRDSLAIANSPSDRDDQAFVDAVSVWPGKE
jgi:Protein  of unknown function (DUF3018)